MTEQFTPTGRLPGFPEFVGLFVDGELKDYQKELLTNLVNADFSKLEERIIAYGCGRWMVGISTGDEERREVTAATVIGQSTRGGVFVIVDEIVDMRMETVLDDLRGLGSEPIPPKDIFFGVDPVWEMHASPSLEPVAAQDEIDQRPFAKKTQHTKKPLPYYLGNKRRF